MNTTTIKNGKPFGILQKLMAINQQSLKTSSVMPGSNWPYQWYLLSPLSTLQKCGARSPI
jgi:hypothetical protein